MGINLLGVLVICVNWLTLAEASSAPICFNGSPSNLALQDQLTQSKNHFENRLKSEKDLAPMNFVDWFHKATRENQQTEAGKLKSLNLDRRIEEIQNDRAKMSLPRKVLEQVLDQCQLRPSSDNLHVLKSLQQAAAKIDAAIQFPRIKKACILASLKRQNTTQGYYCKTPQSKPTPIGPPGSQGPCITDEMVEYVTWAVNSAIQCNSTRSEPLDPLVVLKKMNNETGFSFFQASAGGVGIGQLTSPAVNEVNRVEHDTLGKIRNSNNPACLPFKSALRNTSQPADPTEWCSLLHFSEGFANNLTYSMAYFIHSREKLMSGFQSQLERCGIERADVKDMGALAAYGPKGLQVQEPLIRLLKPNCKNPDRFIHQAETQIKYLKQTQQKLKEALELADVGVDKIEDCIE